ncbi:MULTISPECIES: hypothetical protein [unclassified Pseudomonas]|uniref:hypothetical protein n=1 Tax=unclassified Pseudomonas TaxID=196821 RepID=UPI002114026A|nr:MULTISPECIES: hypothetical protein [unclassified Pseudomonas]
MTTENRSSNTEMVSVPFQREDRYIVVKRSDLALLSPVDSDLAHSYLEGVMSLMAEWNCPARECLVIESDWPEFAPAWASIEERVTGGKAPQPHPEPIAWMVGTAIWWTKEEAERDAAATGLPIVGLGPMTGAGEAEQIREVIKHSDDQIMRQSLRISNQRALLAERDALLRELLADDVPLRLAAKIETALSASTEPSAPGKQGAPLGAVRAPEIQDLLDRAATAIGQYGDSLLGRGQREDSVDLLDLEREVRDLEQQFKGAFAQPST